MEVIFPEMPGSTRQKKARPWKRRSFMGLRVIKTLAISRILGGAVVVSGMAVSPFANSWDRLRRAEEVLDDASALGGRARADED